MPRISIKLSASVIGSLALLLGAACERSTETTPEPGHGATGTVQEPNSMRPTPSPTTPGTSMTPGTSVTPGTAVTPGGTSRPSASAPIESPDTLPVRGTDPDMLGSGGAGGHGGHGGHSGHSGHGGKPSH